MTIAMGGFIGWLSHVGHDALRFNQKFPEAKLYVTHNIGSPICQVHWIGTCYSFASYDNVRKTPERGRGNTGVQAFCGLRKRSNWSITMVMTGLSSWLTTSQRKREMPASGRDPEGRHSSIVKRQRST